ncbi:hypothetical protein ABEB36_014147 [Hypothenemus hampei]|uniref:MADF domain-containing protein n=1 Tax=Hypothenemus hampei TaxID=57062 RepID=A0ABD1E667_HYPHA
MSDLRQCSHDFLSEFIELYRSFPCLWQVKSKEYSDRDRKNQAYEIVVEKFKQVDPTATRDTVIKKINSLRTVYRKELAKVKQSIHSGAADEDIYKPTLWYFDLLSFLGDQDTPRRSRNTTDDETTQGSEDTEEVRKIYFVYLVNSGYCCMFRFWSRNIDQFLKSKFNAFSVCLNQRCTISQIAFALNFLYFSF